ncbi:MAG: isoprenylcysteine carboxylmethyltransferase family protein [Sphingobacteriales bacterium]|nr:isoprenylcysteine carboxylmethyltransferase family protein [Sphingobacteriales bacterium]
MEQLLRVILPLYFIIYFGVAFVVKSWIVAKRIGKNPLVLPKDDSAYGLIGRYFKMLLILMFVYVLIFAAFPDEHAYFLPLVVLHIPLLQYTGLALLALALIWTVVAQADMKNSWRIGIDTETKTELITTGLFRYSRNPVFFGMMMSMLGLFFTTPNALAALFLVVGYMLMQIQIRLEEEFLTREHGQVYLAYRQKVRRLI